MAWKRLLHSADEVHDPTGSTLVGVTTTKEAIDALDVKAEANESNITALQSGKLDVGAQAADSALLQGQNGAHYLSRTNHTGLDEISDVNGLQAALDAKEDGLGNPLTDDFVLSSKIDGTRNWVAQGAGSGTDLSNTPTSTQVTIESSSGNDTILEAAGVNAGVMTAAQVTALNQKITGPGAVTANRVAVFDGITGFLVKEAAFTEAETMATSVDGQINGLATKGTPVDADMLLLEDSAAGFAKKKFPWSALPSGGGGVEEAPDDANRTYFREGTTPGWTKNLKSYGDTHQTGVETDDAPTLANGNVLFWTLAGMLTIASLTATETSQSATWIIRHNTNTISWPPAFKFAGGNAPDTANGDTIILGLFTVDSGATWIVTAVEEYTLA